MGNIEAGILATPLPARAFEPDTRGEGARWRRAAAGVSACALHVLALIALLLDAPPSERMRPPNETGGLLMAFEVPELPMSTMQMPAVTAAILTTPAVEITEPALPEIEDETPDAQQVVRQPERFTPPRPADQGLDNLAQYAESAALRAGEMRRVILRVEILRSKRAAS